MHTSRCRRCRRLIRWAITEAGNRQALDPDRNDAGNVVVTRLDFYGNEYCRTLHKGEETTLLRLMPHAASCPGDQ